MTVRLLVLLTSILVAVGCTSVRSLDDPPAPLSAAERDQVVQRVEDAIADERWGPAWSQAVDAGLGRETFERIALGAVFDDASGAEDMLEAVRERWGGWTPEAERRIDARIQQILGGEAYKDYEEAVRIAIETANDAPTYARAMRVYEQIPRREADEAAAVLEQIGEARREQGEGSD